MHAGAGKVDITPRGSVHMEGMIRTGKSTGVHDRLYARALVMANAGRAEEAWAVVSTDVCLIGDESIERMKSRLAKERGMDPRRLIVASTHTHSGPSTCGSFQPVETEYLRLLEDGVVAAVAQGLDGMRPALAACGDGREETISHYRRFMDDGGKIVMIWEKNPAETRMRPLGTEDTQLGVLKVVRAEDPSTVIGVLFNHAGHPNVMSGDNLEISADYPGVAQRVVEERHRCVAMFMNGAQGTMDIDNWKYRDWSGMEVIGTALADAVESVLRRMPAPVATPLVGQRISYPLPARRISDAEYKWAKDILAVTGGTFKAMPDGVGDDYKALLYDRLRGTQDTDIPFEQVCFAMGDTAFLSLKCELFTEVGMEIKRRSPFAHTYLLGLANGCIGYVPAAECVSQGGYEVDTRPVDEAAAALIVQNSLEVLGKVHAMRGAADGHGA